MTQAIKVPAGRGVGWIADGWRTFVASPGMWIVLTLVWILLNMALMALPLVGQLVAWFVAPTLAGGLLIAADDARAGRELDLACLFRPLTDSVTRNPILILGGIYLGANLGALVLGIVILVAAAGAALVRHHGGTLPVDPAQIDPAVLFAMGGVALLIALLVFTLILLITLLFFFAIPLVTFERAEPGRAIATGLRGLLRNWAPLTMMGLLYIPLSLLATVPLGLGWLILVPMTFGMWYASYRDVFGAPPADTGEPERASLTLPPAAE